MTTDRDPPFLVEADGFPVVVLQLAEAIASADIVGGTQAQLRIILLLQCPVPALERFLYNRDRYYVQMDRALIQVQHGCDHVCVGAEF